MWRWEGVREGVKMRRCEDEKVWEKVWRRVDVKRSRCEDEKVWEKMWRWEGVRRCEDGKMWRWADVKMWRWEGVRRCEDGKMWRWADVKMRRCERRCEDEKVWRWEGEDEKVWEKVWRWEGVKMRRCEDEKVWRWEDEIQTPTIGRTLRSDALGNKWVLIAFFSLHYGYSNIQLITLYSRWIQVDYGVCCRGLAVPLSNVYIPFIS